MATFGIGLTLVGFLCTLNGLRLSLAARYRRTMSPVWRYDRSARGALWGGIGLVLAFVGVLLSHYLAR